VLGVGFLLWTYTKMFFCRSFSRVIYLNVIDIYGRVVSSFSKHDREEESRRREVVKLAEQEGWENTEDQANR